MKRLFLIVVALSAFVLGGCNTMKGIGQDIEKGGEAIQKAVK
jgi:entericidin B